MRHRLRMAACLTVAAALAASASAARPAASWEDPLGDLAGRDAAPDIRSVRPSETAVRASVTVGFDAGVPYSYSDTERYVDSVMVVLDADGDGELGEDDYVAGTHAVRANEAVLVRLGPPDGEPKWRRSVPASTSATSVTVSLPKLLIGNPGSLRFRVFAGREYVDAERGGADACPDVGMHAYRLTPVAIRSVWLPPAARRPAARRILSLSGIRGVMANGARVALTGVSATARIGSTPLRRVGERAVSWRLPGGARGKTVIVSATGRVGAASRITTWRLRVR